MILALLLAAAQPAEPSVSGPEEKQSVQHVRVLPSALATVWLTAGYDWTSNVPPTGPASAFGLDLGGGLLFRVVGPVYFGALFDYGLTGPNALLVAGAAGLVVEDFTFSGGFGYSSAGEGGFGALLGLEYGLASGVALRVQVSWRHSSFTGADSAEHRLTVWSALGGLSFTL